MGGTGAMAVAIALCSGAWMGSKALQERSVLKALIASGALASAAMLAWVMIWAAVSQR